MAACVFCRILAGSLAAHVVLEDEAHVGILDHRPLFPGHVLVLPRAHVETMMDLGDEATGPLFVAARRLLYRLKERQAA